ncbi:MAG: DUF418 domain-containing protein [Robiginitalea sp.]
MPTAASKTRMTIVDALRGFSLAGIVIVHMVENYVGGPAPEEFMQATNQGIPDQIVNIFTFIFLRGKFFALFSFLFGLSFFIQMDSAARRGQDFRGRFLWRLCLLLAIGYLHHLFYRGDILTIYALVGMALIPFYRIRSTRILLFAGLIFIGLPRFLLYAMGAGDGLLLENAIDPASPDNAEYLRALESGTLFEVWKSNSFSGHLMKAEFQIGVGGRAYLTFAFFLLGLLMGRIGYFRTYPEYLKLTRKALWISLGTFIIGTLLVAVFFMKLGPEPDFNTWWAMAGLTAYDISNLGMTGMILAGFVLLYQRSRAGQLLNLFAPYGRMALTNYILQTLLGTLIFYGWGFGYLGSVPNRYAFLMALGIIALQLQISRWWLKKYYYGPLEWVWRSLTYFRPYPLKRSP